MITKKPRGRNGGRKPTVEGRPMDKITLRLFSDQVEWLRNQGNASESARAALDVAIAGENNETIPV